MENHKNISQSIWQKVGQATDILIVSHRNPDGDTIGANLALAIHLKKLGKNVTSFCFDPIPASLKFLPQNNIITDTHLIFTKKYDLIITVDCSNLELASIENLITALKNKFTLINIDHHISNPLYGDINLVLPNTSSTCELLYDLLSDWQITWNQDLATNLTCGILTDTGGLKNPSTTYLSISAVANLISYGANISKITQKTMNQTTVSKLKLWGRALERLKKINKYNLVYTWLTQQDFIDCQVDETVSEGLSNFLHILNEGKITMILKETNNQMIKGSLRTNADIDLTKLAAKFGGGGHKKAAGFSLPGRLEYANNKLRIV